MRIFPTQSHTISEIGKHIGERIYLHLSAVDSLSLEGRDALTRAQELSDVRSDAFNVVRFEPANDTVTFLQYTDFFEDACPALSESWKVCIGENNVAHRRFDESFNPPILHRKELLLAPDHPDRSRFERLTTQLESIGLFQDPVRIGFRLQWERLLAERGFRLVGHDLVPLEMTKAIVLKNFSMQKRCSQSLAT
jgi:DNA phosphorothioation-associated putative methyltransferase